MHNGLEYQGGREREQVRADGGNNREGDSQSDSRKPSTYRSPTTKITDDDCDKDEDYKKGKPRRGDLENFTSKNKEVLNTYDIEREGNSQEEYQEEVAVQLEEQEEDLEKIKEESRRPRLMQPILEKHKYLQL